MSVDVYVLDTGAANLASMVAALRRADARPTVGLDAERAKDARAVVLPGVGAFGPAAAQLQRSGLDDVLRRRIERDAPTLAVCLGLQLLGRASAESRGARGIGAFDLRAERFSSGVRTPHLGWSPIRAEPNCELLDSGWAAFAHSYRLTEAPVGWTAAWCERGERFIAALERGAVLACQFHPELSGDLGARLLARWLERAARSVSPTCPKQGAVVRAAGGVR
ncbi:MAG: imidazole glycerol phosphate synthase subunit HisH [Planctomycetaceae bacterium]|nr:imidazole glycerol phosphate synthase subunit HisH [Planctomycetaceae bacterium]